MLMSTHNGHLYVLIKFVRFMLIILYEGLRGPISAHELL
jgi:hypothetical protein